jgi:putative MATE family efflux protein
MTKNLTVGSPALLIFGFTMPLLVGNLFQQFYSMADAFIVGNTIGVEALAAVGCTGSVMFLILGFVMGFSSGLAIVTAQRFGAGDVRGVRRSFAVSIVLALALTVIITTVSVAAAKPLLMFLRTPADIIDGAYSYIIVIFSGTAALVLFNLLSSVMRAVGDSRTPLVFLVITCILNIILDYLFILAFHMGVAGAAWATVIAQILSGLACIPVVLKKLPVLRLRKDDCRVSWKEIKAHVRIALPMGFQMSIIAIGFVVLQFVLNGLGTAGVAAFTAAQKIDQFANLPFNSFGAAMSTYTAQNYGARRMDRIKQGVISCSLMSGAFGIVMGTLFIFAGNVFAGFFIKSNDEVVSLAHIYLVINGSCYILLSLLLVFRQTLQGLGSSLVPTIAGIMELLMRTFAAVILSGFFGFYGLCFASPLAWFGACVPMGFAVFFAMKKLNREALAVKKQG